MFTTANRFFPFRVDNMDPKKDVKGFPGTIVFPSSVGSILRKESRGTFTLHVNPTYIGKWIYRDL